MRRSMGHMALPAIPTHTRSMDSYLHASRNNSRVRDFDSSLRRRSTDLFDEFHRQRRHSDDQRRRSDDERRRSDDQWRRSDARHQRGFNAGHQRENTENQFPDVLGLLGKVCTFLAELSKDVVNVIASSKEELSKSVEITSLVNLYYESTNKTLDLFNTVENCVTQAESSQLLIRVAIQRFETESMGAVVGGNNRYAATLEELNRVKDMENPFGDEFATQYKAVYDDHVNLMKKLGEMQEKLDKNHSSVKRTRTVVVGSILFGTILFAGLALSLFSLTLASPLVAKAVASGLAATATSTGAGLWVNAVLKDYDRAIESQKNVVSQTENHMTVNFEAIKMINNLVKSLKAKMSSILNAVEVIVEVAEERREDEAVRLVMQDIIQKVEEFAEKINQVGANVAECTDLIVSGKARVLAHMNQLH